MPKFAIMVGICVGHSPQTRSFAPAAHIAGACVYLRRGFGRQVVPLNPAKRDRDSPSRPLCGLASKLLLTQKTKFPCLTTVCSGKSDTMLP